MEGALKILLMGDASNYHASLAEGLRRLGHDVTVASDGSRWMDTERDIDIRRRWSGRVGGALHYLHLLGLRGRFGGYDVVSVTNPVFLQLRPHRVRRIFDRLVKDNRGVFLTALGTDTAYVEMCLGENSPLVYNELKVGDALRPHSLKVQAWLEEPLRGQSEHVYGSVKGATTVLYEYDLAMRRVLDSAKVGYVGIPIDTAGIEPVELPERPEKVELFLGRHSYRQSEKGTDLLEAVAREVVSRHPGKAELRIVEDLPYREYVEAQKRAHVVLDQVYSYTPSTNALLAMARGLNVVSGGEEPYYRFIGEWKNRPIINAQPDYDRLLQTLEDVVVHPEGLRARGLAGREFVEKHNDSRVVAERAARFWAERLREYGEA